MPRRRLLGGGSGKGWSRGADGKEGEGTEVDDDDDDDDDRIEEIVIAEPTGVA